MKNLEERIWDKILPEPNTGCWIWTGATTSAGYGHVNIGKGKTILAHRISYELYREKIPPGLELDHLCCVRSCINPNHLEPVSTAENNRRSKRQDKEYCFWGHLLDERNLYIDPKGQRICRECRRLSLEKYLQSKDKGN